MDNEALEKKRAYFRDYYAKNKERYKKSNIKYWENRSRHDWHENNKIEGSDEEWK